MIPGACLILIGCWRGCVDVNDEDFDEVDLRDRLQAKVFLMGLIGGGILGVLFVGLVQALGTWLRG